MPLWLSRSPALPAARSRPLIRADRESQADDRACAWQLGGVVEVEQRRDGAGTARLSGDRTCEPAVDLASDAAYAHSILRTIEGPIVLVGHSYGGAVITNAAVGVPNIKALVYIAGFAPNRGESAEQPVTKNPGSEIMRNPITRAYPLPGGGDGTDLYLTEHGFETAFASDLPKRVADQMWAEQRPMSAEALAPKSGQPAWKTIPSWYLVTNDDHAIPPRGSSWPPAHTRSSTRSKHRTSR